MDLERYLGRLGIGRPDGGVEGLRVLQSAQMASIAFENIDPLLGEVPDVSPAGVFAKLVDGRRGGYCFELNTLFGMALSELGFRATPVMARVRNGKPRGGQRSHLAWIVTIDGEDWLADTGFGGAGSSVPLRIAHGGEQQAPTGRYRFLQDGEAGECVLERRTPGGWFALFGFDRVPVREADIEAANFVCARWDKAPFSSNLMLSSHRADGRVSLLNTALRVEGRDGVTRHHIASEEELRDVLAGEFGLAAVGGYASAVWRRLDALGHLDTARPGANP